MKQVEVYKEALRIMERAKLTITWVGYVFWKFETFCFWSLCPLIRTITSEDRRVISRFKLDSETVLSRNLLENDLWFTHINKDEPKARKERIEHLKNLIKLYENGK